MYSISDSLQNFLNLHDYKFVRDVILILSLVVFYLLAPLNGLWCLAKFYALGISIRFLLSLLTTIRHKETQIKYFQTSGHVLLFSFIILILSKFNNGISQQIAFITILLYALLNIATKAHFTTDVAYTILLVYFLFNNNYLQTTFCI